VTGQVQLRNPLVAVLPFGLVMEPRFGCYGRRVLVMHGQLQADSDDSVSTWRHNGATFDLAMRVQSDRPLPLRDLGL
jgi:hypothetical protein